jgi:hypothetical protein
MAADDLPVKAYECREPELTGAEGGRKPEVGARAGPPLLLPCGEIASGMPPEKVLTGAGFCCS